MTRVWYHVFGWGDDRAASAIVELLANAGLSTQPFDPRSPGGPGVILFDENTQSLRDFIRETSRDGLERMLAVAVSPAVLEGDSVWLLLKAGASDVIAWDDSTHLAEQIRAQLERWEIVDNLVRSPLVRENLVGQSPAWISTVRDIVDVARFTDASVLVLGESGTGKELAAHLIHTLDPRPDKQNLVVVDCTTIVPDLSGSEFFGHERGAFTGAVGPREGAFALADGGTLFLDEVGDLPPELQAQLLRVVQEHTYKPVGGNTWHNTAFRLLCATNRDLLAEVREGRFRRDLYHRIATWTFQMPPLRDRREDILPLAEHFLRELDPDDQPLQLDKYVRDYLLQREYPGNVRDLKQLVTRIRHRHVRPGPITVGAIPVEERPTDFGPVEWRDELFHHSIRRALSLGVGLKEISRTAEETAIRIAVADVDGNLQQAADKLKVTARALQMRRAAERQRGP